tara:strand:- start:18 stop:377 length:360 start_codon:yes stop_codon:yes gene_type:complete
MSNPTAKQKRWLEYVAKQPCIATGFNMIQVHHIWGRETKVKGVGNIGHWAILPIWYCLHDVSSDDPHNVTHHKNAFEDKFGKQGDIFSILYANALIDESFNSEDLPPIEVLSAVANYRR